MHAPEVIPENYEEIYQYYDGIEPHRNVIVAIHKAMRILYHPHIHFTDGAELEIKERIKEKDSVIFASNHLNIADQFPIAALVDISKVFKPLEGNIFALSKPSYFRSRILRPALDATGTLPVFRPQDVSDRRLQAAAIKSLIEIAAKNLKAGWSMVLFPEGTRNKDDPRVLGTIGGVIGRIASRASEEVGVSIIPMALWYMQDEKRHLLRPEILIGNPIVGPFHTKSEAIRPLRIALQSYVTKVSEHDF